MKIKKYRQLHEAFIVEGAKSVLELLASDFEVEFILSTLDFQQKYSSIFADTKTLIETVTAKDLEGLGLFQTNDSCLAVAKTKDNVFFSADMREYALILDDIRDPGNLGTIIRIADWYGIRKIICSSDTTDFYNPKVIAASKGSFTRTDVYYTNLPEFLSLHGQGRNVLGAFLDGGSIYDHQFSPEGGYVVMGNESNGISAEVESFITDRITIPRVGGAESLNVGIATAVMLDNMQRSIK